MKRIVDPNVLDKIQLSANPIIEFIGEKTLSIEEGLAQTDKGLATKVLAQLVGPEGARKQWSYSQIIESLSSGFSEKNIEASIKKLKSSGLINELPSGKFEITNNVLAREVFQKVEAENLILQQVRGFLQVKSKGNNLLSQEDLNYVNPYRSQLTLSSAEADLIQRSEARIASERRRRNFFLGAVFSLLSLFAIAALISWSRANDKNKELIVATEALVVEKDKVNELRKKEKGFFEKETKLINQQKEESDSLMNIAQASAKQEAIARKRADEKTAEAIRLRKIADEKTNEAKLAKDNADMNALKAQGLKKIAEDKEEIARKAEAEAKEAKAIVEKLNAVNISRNVAAKLSQLDDSDLPFNAYLAGKIYEINKDSEVGNLYHPDVYLALSTTASLLNKGRFTKKTYVHKGMVKSILFDPLENQLITAGTDGTVRVTKFREWFPWPKSWDDRWPKEKPLLENTQVINHLAFSGDEQSLLVARSKQALEVLDRERFQKVPNPKVYHQGKGIVKVVSFAGSDVVYTLGGDKKIRKNIGDKSEVIVSAGESYTALSGFKNEALNKYYVLYSTLGGNNGQKIFIKDLTTEEESEISSRQTDKKMVIKLGATVYANKTHIVLGYDNGVLEFGELNASGQWEIKKSTTIHKSMISAIEVSENGQLIAVACLDGSVSVWNMEEYLKIDYQPLYLLHAYYEIDKRVSWVTALTFSTDNQYLITGTKDGYLKVFNMDPTAYANVICERQQENEFNISDKNSEAFKAKHSYYFGTEIKISEICQD